MRLTNCVICGEQFRTFTCYLERGQHRCCSHRCAGILRRQSRPSAKLRRLCEKCGAGFDIYPSQAKGTQGRFCSRICANGQPRVFENGNCKMCGKPIVAKGPQQFCSVACARKWASGSNNPQWKGGRPMAICVACGKEYEGSYDGKSIVCSLRCWGAVKTKLVPGRPHPTGKGGKRPDLGDVYFRSRWEANWARYLNWLISIGEIASWSFEPDTFEFKKIKKGTKFYTPDFKVTNKDGSIEYHEIKGWLTQKGKTQLKRMAKYYPEIKIVLVRKDYYRSVANKVSALIPNWERCPKHGA